MKSDKCNKKSACKDLRDKESNSTEQHHDSRAVRIRCSITAQNVVVCN